MSAAVKPAPAASLFRFRRHMPLSAAIVLNPAASAALAVVVAIAASFFSIHYALGVVILWLGVFAFYLDRRLLDFVLIPPFALVMAWEALSLGLGLPIVVWARGGEFVKEFAIMQVVHVVLFPLAWGAYLVGFRRIPGMAFPRHHPQFGRDVVHPLVILGWMFLVWRVVQLTMFAATGAEDRGDFGIVSRGEHFGIWTYLAVFPRFNSLGFFLFPLVLSRCKGAIKALPLAILGFYLVVAFATGARGNVFYPIIYIGIGSFFFGALRSVRVDVVGIAMIVAFLPVIVFMDHFRNTEAYKASRTIDLRQRLAAVGEVGVRSREITERNSERENYVILGGALAGVSDQVIYEQTPSVIPHAGTENFDGMLYTWVPYFLFRDRPVLFDANILLIDYFGGVYTRTGRAITLQADLYRRFGWLGIPIGVGVFWLGYGLFCGYVYRLFLFRNALLGTMFILFLFSYFQSRPSSTVLTTWWMWAYEMPKHLLAMLAIYFVLKLVLGLQSIRGAAHYIAGSPR